MPVRFGIDTGGTFTDLIGIDAAGGFVVAKTPSTPARPVDAIMAAIARGDVGADALEAISMGTTVATNALLQRTGATVLYVTTAGFEDVRQGFVSADAAREQHGYVPDGEGA